jgi:hypothetical protein
MPEPQLTLFIAFAESDARMIEVARAIHPGMFTAGGGIPLKTSVSTALSSALAVDTLQAMVAAVQTTEWYVLEIKFDDVGPLFLNHSLRHSRDRNGPGVFAFHAPLLLTRSWTITGHLIDDHDWHEIQVAPTGLDAWGAFFLRRKYWRTDGTCHHCDTKGNKVWQNKAGEHYHCLACWHAYCQSTSAGDVHALALRARAAARDA